MQSQLRGQKNKMNLNFSLKVSKQKEEVHLGKGILLVGIKMNKDKQRGTERNPVAVYG